ncbi:MAG: MBL fold metallo-hydrolase [Desulfamplus sp.]|nr:MBL fold metallo-hydrolase [Desulfamplus sp.]
MESNTILEKIKWLGHDCMMIDSVEAGYPIIYFDPYQIETKDKSNTSENKADASKSKADIILITHEHYDHCSPEDVKKILGQNTIIVTEKDSAKKLKKELGKSVEGKIEVIAPGDNINVKGINIAAVPSYNIDKKFHPKSKNWLGFVVDIGRVKVYHAGDTDLIPEMSDIKCDIAFLPVSGTYVMTAGEAISAALEIKPQVAIPMHYGSLVGGDSDAEMFKKGLEGKIDVHICYKNG